MAFVTEKEELKPGLILFRRGDVGHRMWYCRMKMPKADRYKTVSLKTTDIRRGAGTRLRPGCRHPVSHQA
jgi:integrase